MKARIKIDGFILSLVIFTTLFINYFFHDYGWQDEFFDFLGLIVILTGNLIRMSARSHKKKYSGQGHELVVSGPYAFVRNPMYLGTFLIGVGFALIVWPWFLFPIFVIVFYLRFNIQILKEEVHLRRLFPSSYDAYIKQVPKLLPPIQDLRQINLGQVFPIKDIWATKENNGLIFWPLIAILLEMAQEGIVFGYIDVKKILIVFGFSLIVFWLIIGVGYLRSTTRYV